MEAPFNLVIALECAEGRLGVNIQDLVASSFNMVYFHLFSRLFPTFYAPLISFYVNLQQ